MFSNQVSKRHLLLAVVSLIVTSLINSINSQDYEEGGEEGGENGGYTDDDTAPEDWITREMMDTECTKRKCWSSDKALPVCGSDGRTYTNPGVLRCAQVCKPSKRVVPNFSAI